MAKGDDAVMRKKSKVNRKRIRNSESSVSNRIASIIASKRRRKAGKRRGCEGMCFTLPTLDDPFNDRHDKKAIFDKKPKKPPPQKPNRRKSPPPTQEGRPPVTDAVKKVAREKGDNKSAIANGETPIEKARASVNSRGKGGSADDGNFEDGCVSKFLILCLKSIQDSLEGEGDSSRPLLASSWGVEFWRCCSSGWNVLDTSGACASIEQASWIVSTASDIITRKEKQGLIVPSPFLLYLVPSQEKAAQVRSVCKPLKAVGVHTVSLHPGASVDHQVNGLKSCEPEFLVSTPERLLELASLQAIDISGVSLLVLDGLKDFADFGFLDKLKSIRENISGEPRIVVFSDSYGEAFVSVMHYLLQGPVYRLSLNDSVACQGAFVSQSVHFYTSEEEKLSKALQILTEAFDSQRLPQPLKILLIGGSATKCQMLASHLKAEGYAVSKDSPIDGSHGANGEKAKTISVRDRESLQSTDVEEFEVMMFLEFPSSIEDYVGSLTKVARRSIAGVVHSFFCRADAHLAQPLIEVLEQCDQPVPDILRNFDSS